MAPYECSVADCDYVTPEATPAQMLNLLTLHANCVHLTNQPAAPAAVASKLEKLPRPVFSLNMTEADWQFKEIDWNSYIEQTPSSDNAKLLQLRAACDDSLRQRVCDSGGWTLRTVPELLARIKDLAVVKIHKSRHLANLYNIVQQSDEPVRAFVARLTGTADMCGMQVQRSGLSTPTSSSRLSSCTGTIPAPSPASARPRSYSAGLSETLSLSSRANSISDKTGDKLRMPGPRLTVTESSPCRTNCHGEQNSFIL